MNKKETDTFYWDFEKQEPVRVLYQVRLTMPAFYDGNVEIEADSEEEAARLALDERFGDVDWEFSCDRWLSEVVHVECDNPPANTFMVGRNRSTSTNLSALFYESEDETPEAELPLSSGQQAEKQTGGVDDPCN
jgi:hypothetical protein